MVHHLGITLYHLDVFVSHTRQLEQHIYNKSIYYTHTVEQKAIKIYEDFMLSEAK